MIAPTDDQPETLVGESALRMTNRQSEDCQQDGALVDGIPSGGLLPGFEPSSQAPRTLFVALQIAEVIVGFPA